MKRLFRVFLTGLIALLPIVVTVVATLWLVDYASQYLRPDSRFGQMLISIGLSFDANSPVPYAIGLLSLVTAIWVFGLIVETSIGPWIMGFFEGILHRIPIVGSIFDVVKRMVSLMDKGGQDELENMSPAWCFFGGDKGGAAVLALLPTKEVVKIGSDEYLGILVPTAPVPIGGALIYVPAIWLEPAEGGVDHLMSVYVSMGVQPPRGLRDQQNQQIDSA